jgi:two-component system, OmpR family, sensor kinase
MKLPIRLRLTLISAGLMAAVLVALGVFLVNRLEADLIATVDAGLRSRASVLLDRIGEGGGVSSSNLTEGDEAFAQLLASDGSILVSSRGVTEPILSADEVSAVVAVDVINRTVDTGDDPVDGRLFITRTGDGDVLVVGASLEDPRDAVAGLTSLLLIGIPAAVALASIVGWIVAGAALRPVERLRQEADAISASEPGRRLPVPDTGDELSRLAASLNRMLGRLQEAMEQERRFVADASHELRTPLANLRAEVDLALRRARTADELGTALRSVREETDRLGRLAEDLLVLARLSEDGLHLRREPTDLGRLVSETVDSFAGRAEGLGVDLVTEADRDLVALADGVRLRQAVGNLLDNALRSTPRGGRVAAVAKATAGGPTLEVTDTGPGFPAEFIDRAGEGFRRPDLARRRTSGGAGLGLAIVRAIVDAHGGAVHFENAADGGARVSILLPAGS